MKKQMIFGFTVFLFSSVACVSAAKEKNLREQFLESTGFVEGSYSAEPGSPDDCNGGDYIVTDKYGSLEFSSQVKFSVYDIGQERVKREENRDGKGVCTYLSGANFSGKTVKFSEVKTCKKVPDQKDTIEDVTIEFYDGGFTYTLQKTIDGVKQLPLVCKIKKDDFGDEPKFD
jgi:hypothetical protein